MITDTGTLLHRAILADPADETARLAYADCLEENGNPGYAAYIRRAVAICHPERLNPDHDMSANWDGVIDVIHQYPPGDPDHCPLCRAIIDQRNDPHTRAIAATIGNMIGWPADWSGRPDPGVPNYVGVRCRAGFAHRVTTTADVFLRHAAELFRSQPLAEVWLPDRRPHQWEGRARLKPGEPRSRSPRGWAWYNERTTTTGEERDVLPAPLFAAVKALAPPDFDFADEAADFPTRSAAWKALSAGAVALGRGLAGLPPLPAVRD